MHSDGGVGLLSFFCRQVPSILRFLLRTVENKRSGRHAATRLLKKLCDAILLGAPMLPFLRGDGRCQ